MEPKQHSTSLSEIQRARKEVDKDAQLLANRIRLLRLEEQRTWKKIEETKKKAKDIIAVKKREEERMKMREEIKIQKERMTSAQRENYLRLRESRKSEQGQAQMALIQSKRVTVLALKADLISQRERKNQLLDQMRQANLIKAKEVQGQRERGLAKVRSHMTRKHQAARQIYFRKLSEEDRRAREREKEVMDMELLEMELIEKLKTTQMVQQQAYNDLEQAMGQPRHQSFDQVSKGN